MGKSNLLKLYRDLLNYYFRVDKEYLTVDDKPYMNFMTVLSERVSTSKYYDSDLMEFVVSNEIKELKKLKKMPESITNEDIEKLIEIIIKTFEANKAEHFIIIPIPRATLEKVVHFDKFTFIPWFNNRNEKIQEISNVTNLDIEELNSFLTHTERSRSPDFLKHNLLIIKVDNQTDFVRFNAEKIAKYCIYLLRIIYYAKVLNPSISDFVSDLRLRLKKRKPTYDYTKNSHIAIVSKDDWRNFHSPINFKSECSFDMSFIEDPNHQDLFKSLTDDFIFNPDNDEFTWRFLNASILFNKALEIDDDSLSILLFITVGESLLTQERNEKRLRLSALLSRLVEVDDYTTPKIAEIIDIMYRKRNDFVHAGEKIFLLHDSEDIDSVDSKLSFRLLRCVIAKLIVDFRRYIELLNEREPQKNKIDAWTSYLDDMFIKIIRGEKI
jgi:hypothetical protein